MGEAYSVLADPGKRALYDQGRLHQSIQAQYTANAAAAAAVHAKVKITGSLHLHCFVFMPVHAKLNIHNEFCTPVVYCTV